MAPKAHGMTASPAIPASSTTANNGPSSITASARTAKPATSSRLATISSTPARPTPSSSPPDLPEPSMTPTPTSPPSSPPTMTSTTSTAPSPEAGRMMSAASPSPAPNPSEAAPNSLGLSIYMNRRGIHGVSSSIPTENTPSVRQWLALHCIALHTPFKED